MSTSTAMCLSIISVLMQRLDLNGLLGIFQRQQLSNESEMRLLFQFSRDDVLMCEGFVHYYVHLYENLNHLSIRCNGVSDLLCSPGHKHNKNLSCCPLFSVCSLRSSLRCERRLVEAGGVKPWKSQ